MSSQNNELSRRVLDQVWNQRNLDIIDEMVAVDFTFHDPMAPAGIGGVATYKQFVHAHLAAFPDLRLIVEDSISDGEMVATCWTARGTHTGEWPATRRLVKRSRSGSQLFADCRREVCRELGLLGYPGNVPAAGTAAAAGGRRSGVMTTCKSPAGRGFCFTDWALAGLGPGLFDGVLG